MNPLHEQLKSPDEETRLEAVKAILKKKLINLEDQGILKKLSRKDLSAKVRHFVRLSLLALHKTSLSEKFPQETDFETFKTFSLSEKFVFIEYFTRRGKQNGIPILKMVLESETDPIVISQTLTALSLMRSKEILSVIFDHLVHADRRVVKAAILALRFAGEVADLPFLIRVKNPDDPLIRNAVRQAVETFPDHDLFALFFRLVSDEEEKKKAVLLKFFSMFFRNEFFPFLIELSQCPNAKISQAATYLLENHKQDLEEKLEGKPAKTSPSGRFAGYGAPGTPPSLDGSTTGDLDETIDRYLESHWNISPSIIRELRNPSAQVRVMALKKVLGKLSWDFLQPEMKSMIPPKEDPRALATMIPIFAKLKLPGMLGKLLAFREHEDGRVRANLVETLPHFEDDDRFESLVTDFINDSHNRVVANAVTISAGRFPSVAAKGIERLLSEFGTNGKKSAIFALTSMQTEGFMDSLEKLACDPDDEIKNRAIEGLQLLALEGSEKARCILNDFPNAGSALWDEVTNNVGKLEPIEKVFTPERVFLEKLKFELESPDESERSAAVKALGTIGDESVLEAIYELTKDETDDLRYEAGRAYDQIKKRTETSRPSNFERGKDRLTLKWLKTQLSNPSRAARANALKAIGPDDRHLLPELLEHLRVESEPTVKPLLISVISRLGNKEVLPSLVPFLGDNDARVRANTVEALTLIGDETVCPLLIALLNDGNHRVKANALRGLDKFGSEKAWEAFREMLVSKEARMRISALHVLGDFGKTRLNEVLGLIPAFLENETDYYIFARAVEACVKLLSGEPVKGVLFLRESVEKLQDPKKARLLKWGINSLEGSSADLEKALNDENILATSPGSLFATEKEKAAQSISSFSDATKQGSAETVTSSIMKGGTRPLSTCEVNSQVSIPAIGRGATSNIASSKVSEKCNFQCNQVVPEEKPTDASLEKIKEDLNSQYPDVRRTAIGNLIFSGKAGEEELKALEKPLEDEDKSVSTAAAFAKVLLTEGIAEQVRRRGAKARKSREDEAKQEKADRAESASGFFFGKIREYVKEAPAPLKFAICIIPAFWLAILGLNSFQEDLPAPVVKILKSDFVKTLTSFKKEEGIGKKVSWTGTVREINVAQNTVVIERNSYVFSLRCADPKEISGIAKGANVTVSGRIKSKSCFGAVCIEGKIVGR